MSLKIVLYYCDLLFELYLSSLLQPQRFKGWFSPRHQVKPTLLGPIDRASLYLWTLP
jgi:hypothetical protein